MGDMSEWRWFGTPGHFVAVAKCCFHLHTQVGGYRVSTVGCYHPRDLTRESPPEPIGSGNDLYETMVFRLGPDGEPVDWSEVDSDRYLTPAAAERGHLTLCRKWALGRSHDHIKEAIG